MGEKKKQGKRTGTEGKICEGPESRGEEKNAQEENSAGRRQIYLKTERELRAYMHPLRQKILYCLSVSSRGMTAKQLADHLGIAPSSAGHHLSVLEAAGLAELSHTERIHGLTAKYYRAAPADICLRDTEPAADRMRETLMKHSLNEMEKRFFESIRAMEESGEAPGPENGDMRLGVIHLRPDEAEELQRQTAEFLAAHSAPKEGTVPYEFALLAFQAKEEL